MNSLPFAALDGAYWFDSHDTPCPRCAELTAPSAPVPRAAGRGGGDGGGTGPWRGRTVMLGCSLATVIGALTLTLLR
ncbi:hypothetical protein [Streptomyces sp. NPDC015131]|uniref:hypothetical protein n=1 Tax=Streptomyces sp. NPDC015131 TaxID=3364941 RepID=UPI0036FB145F